jgi:hypothetical protein
MLHTYTKHASMHARRASQRCVLQFGLCTKCTCRRLRAEHDRWDMAMQCCTGYVPLTRLEHCTRTVHVHAALHRRTHARRQTSCSQCTQLICMAKFRKRTVICHAASCPSIECNLHHCMHEWTHLAQYSSNLVAGSRSRSLSHISISCFVCFCQSSSDMPDKSVPSRRSKPLTTTMVRNGDERLDWPLVVLSLSHCALCSVACCVSKATSERSRVSVLAGVRLR